MHDVSFKGLSNTAVLVSPQDIKYIMSSSLILSGLVHCMSTTNLKENIFSIVVFVYMVRQ